MISGQPVSGKRISITAFVTAVTEGGDAVVLLSALNSRHGSSDSFPNLSVLCAVLVGVARRSPTPEIREVFDGLRALRRVG